MWQPGSYQLSAIGYQRFHRHGRGAGVGRDLGVRVTRGLTLDVAVPFGVAVIVTSSNALLNGARQPGGASFVSIAAPTIGLPLFLTMGLSRSLLALRCVKGHVAAHAGAGAVGSHNSEMVSMVCS
jgi:hypothetical protein